MKKMMIVEEILGPGTTPDHTGTDWPTYDINTIFGRHLHIHAPWFTPFGLPVLMPHAGLHPLAYRFLPDNASSWFTPFGLPVLALQCLELLEHGHLLFSLPLAQARERLVHLLC
jgi:hypothetical protein